MANNLIATLKSAHYTSIINEHSSDQRILFATVNKLLQKPSEKRYQPSVDNTALANSFADLRHYISRNYLAIVHVHVRYALLIKNFWQFRSQDLKHTETGPFPLLHLNSGMSCH